MAPPLRPSRPAAGPTAAEVLADVRFSIPALDRSHVSRRRLLNALSATEEVPLVLVSGPAGSGKTSLVAEWLHVVDDGTTGWVTFEDGDPEFWRPVLECLRRLGLTVPAVRGGESDELLAGRKNVLAVAAALVDSGKRWTLVLDGYELASLPLAHEVDYLIGHAIGHLRILLVGRVDPVLPVYRYRLTGEVAEVRGADLAFTDVEAARLLSRLGVTLSADSVHELNALVKGWAAGLVFAAHTLSPASTPKKAAGTVLEQSGDVNEYLVGEVLDRQSPEMREFLLATSVTEVVTPGLVEELLGSRAVPLLTAAARANVFIEPVPGTAGAFRYYPFFRDLLRARIAYESPAPVQELHRRAARWYRNEGAVVQSVQQLVRVAAWQDLAEELVDEGLVGRLLLEGSAGVLRSAAALLPKDVTSPEACLVRAAVALSAGHPAACSTEISRVPGPSDVGAGTLAVTLDVVNAVRACTAEDLATAVSLTESAEASLQVGHLPTDRQRGHSVELRAVLDLARGVVLLRCGRLEKADEALTRARTADAVDEYPYFRAKCWGYLAVTHALEGELSEAETAAARALVAASEGGPAVGEAVANAHVALGLVAVEHYGAETARQQLAYVTEPTALPADSVHQAVVVMVRAALECMSGQSDEAGAALLAAAAGLSATDPWLSDILRAAAGRVAMADGHPRLSLDALGELGPSPGSVMVAAAAHVELGEDERASELLSATPDKQLVRHERVSRRLTEAHLAVHSSGTARTRELLEDALRMAAPVGLRRPFRQTGPALEKLLRDNADLLLRHRWLTDPTVNAPVATPRGPDSPLQALTGELQTVLVEPLTPKELEVLAHLEQLLTTEEIAAQMFVTVNTVRTHVRSVLRKLGVNRRNAAIRRARELGLLSA